MVAQFLLNRRFDLAGDQFVLGLRGKLRIRHLDGNDRRQPLPGVVSRGGDLRLLVQPLPLDVSVERARQGASKPGHMGAAIPLRDVVGVGKHLLLEAVVPLHGHFDADAVLALGLEKHLVIQRRLVGVQVGDKGLEPAVVEEVLGLPRTLID